MKIGGLAGDPIEKPRHIGMAAHRFRLERKSRQFRIGEAPVDRAMADWMKRNGFASASAFGQRMMSFDARAQRPDTQLAGTMRSVTFAVDHMGSICTLPSSGGWL